MSDQSRGSRSRHRHAGNCYPKQTSIVTAQQLPTHDVALPPDGFARPGSPQLTLLRQLGKISTTRDVAECVRFIKWMDDGLASIRGSFSRMVRVLRNGTSACRNINRRLRTYERYESAEAPAKHDTKQGDRCFLKPSHSANRTIPKGVGGWGKLSTPKDEM